ncbi:hypothetical protein P4O66_001027 [Electrophorus voltai]|uniref:PDZ domain-containing protein n=1 Tax=Electrophorus voltai TaxID=2609070 RepID=A0AAD8ZB47_9TELE|nr:hypothetical protein P4O66_001027 [Electrophorus voltai]
MDGRSVGRSDGRSVGRSVGWTDGRSDGRSDRRTVCRLDRRSVGRTDGRTVGQTDAQSVGLSVGQTVGRTDGRTDGRSVGRSVGWTDGRSDGRSDRRTLSRSVCRLDRRSVGRTDGRTDGRSVGWTDGRTVGQTDAQSDCHKPACYEKTVSLSKELSESLGMTVAGGMNSRGWNLPIYVTNIDPNGVVAREGSIRKGDILLNVNGVGLTGVTRSEAVANLKNTTSPVVLRVLEMRPPDLGALDCLPPLNSNYPASPPSPSNGKMPPPTDDYSPVWVSWLQLPRQLYCCKDIVLRRSTSGSLGFSIVGGPEEVSCTQSFFIRSIVEGTPAYNDGRIRCGDILLEVNGKSTWGMTHTALVRLLKELRGRITLTIVSWPGSLL